MLHQPPHWYNTETGGELSDSHIYSPVQSITSIASPKRAWSEIAEASSSTRDRNSDATSQPAKKCKKCDSVNLREKLFTAKFENATRTYKGLKQKIAHPNKKNSTLSALIEVFYKPTITPSEPTGSLMTPEKELNMLLNAESQLPPDASW